MQFARHETFFFREGWLTKGLRFVAGENPKVFHDKNAIEQLGMGSNMVKSLRYWMQATGLTHDEGKKGQALSRFGQLIHSYDPYLEEDLTLWLLHYQLVKHKAMATTWYWFFNEFSFREFDEEMLLQHLMEWASEAGVDMSESSLKRDLDCLLATYLPRRGEAVSDPENNICCPLGELNLLEFVPDGRRRRFRLTQRNVKKIPIEAFWYVIKDQFQDDKQEGICYLDFETLLTGPGQIGKVFSLGLPELISALEDLQEAGYLRVLKTAGLNQISLQRGDDTYAVAAEYYAKILGKRE